MTLTGQIPDVYKNLGMFFLVVAWDQLSFVEVRAIRKGQVTSGYASFLKPVSVTISSASK